MKKKIFISISYLYIALPVAIFFLGWVKFWISIPLCILLVYTYLKALSLDIDLWIPDWNHTNIIKGIIILLLITLWVYSSGIGNLVFQNGDHAYRNALYECLVNNSWPIIKEALFEDGAQLRILTYYIGFWLPAAIIGKIFGITCGYIFQFIWAILGLTIGAILVNSFMKKWSVWPIFFFIMFSGMDALGYILLGNLNVTMSFEHIEWWSGFQFSSFTTQLYFVFNQAIYAWIILPLLMIQKSNRHIILIWSFGLLECTFPFVGMLPFVLYLLFRNSRAVYSTNSLRNTLKELFSVENVLGGGIVGLVSFIYLIGNIATKKNTSVTSVNNINIKMYIMFIIVEIGIYYLYVYKYYKTSPLFYISLAFLLICPLMNVGSGGDFCMRASIPSLTILYFMITQCLRNGYYARKSIYCISMLVFLAIGSITVIHEIGRTVEGTLNLYQTYGKIVNITVPEDQVLHGGNFTAPIENNLFYEYLTK